MSRVTAELGGILCSVYWVSNGINSTVGRNTEISHASNVVDLIT
jgi:hypothetical protein